MKSILLFIGLFIKIHFILANPKFIRLKNSIKTSLNINETDYYFFTEAKQNQFVNISYWSQSTDLECENRITFYELKLDNEPQSFDVLQNLSFYSSDFKYNDKEKYYWNSIEVKKNQTNYLGFKLSFKPEYNNNSKVDIKVESLGSNLYLENNKEIILNNIKSKTPYFLYIKAKNSDTVNLQLTLNFTDNESFPLLENSIFWYPFDNENSECSNHIPIDVKNNYNKEGSEFKFSFSHSVKENNPINYIAFKLMTAYDIASIVAKYSVKDNNSGEGEGNKKEENDDEITIKLSLKFIIGIGIIVVIFIILLIICIVIRRKKNKNIDNNIYKTIDNENPLLPKTNSYKGKF